MCSTGRDPWTVISWVLQVEQAAHSVEDLIGSRRVILSEVGGEIIDVRATQRPIGQTRTEADADASSDVTAWPV
jgi:hypothetical protein